MPPLDPIAPRPTSRRALRIGLLAGLVVVVVGGLAFAASSFVFLWNGEQASLPAGAPVEVVRYFFELQDEGDAEVLDADLEVALGAVRVGPTAEDEALFQAEVDLTSDRLRPRFEGETAGDRARVSLSLGGEEVSLRGVRATRGNAWRLYFSERVPLDLTLSLGAAEADLDFSGIPLAALALDCGMTKARLRFDAPNPVPLERLAISAGLSNFEARGLGNARFQRLDFNGDAGDFTLDFSGAAPDPGATANVNVGMAALTLVLPAGLPVVLDAPSSFATHVDVPSAFERRGKSRWATPGADGLALRIAVNAGPGNVRVRLAD
ncbi:MAG: toast rack family protein [Rubricoccaceae bacterium]|nr:toast rack family protein [Rubricoccaceae bacterium]